MNTDQLLDEILGHLRQVKDSKPDLERILQFMRENTKIEEKEDITGNIPESYKQLIPRIAEDIDCGLIAFINRDNIEYETIPTDAYEEDFAGCREFWLDQIEKVDCWQNRIEIRPLYSSQSFRMMESFIESLTNYPHEQEHLIHILNNKKPFAHFKHYIHASPLREDWFSFKHAYIEKEVAILLDNELNVYECHDDSDDNE